MNIGILQLVGKYIVLFVSFFNFGNYSEEIKQIDNNNFDKDGLVINYVTNNKTVVNYNAKLPSNITNVIDEGQIGLSVKTSKQEETVIQKAEDKVVEKGSGAYGIYKGKLVGYGPDCVGCSGEGYLACRTADGKRFSIKYDGIYYEDATYGKVRILAAPTSDFPCGTIIKVIKKNGVEFLAIVLDKIGTSSTMDNVLMDLAYSSQSDKTVFNADGLLDSSVTYEIQRWGY